MHISSEDRWHVLYDMEEGFYKLGGSHRFRFVGRMWRMWLHVGHMQKLAMPSDDPDQLRTGMTLQKL